MAKGLLGKKIGMTNVYNDAGTLVPVTVVEAGPCCVVGIKTLETDGYVAVQLGFGQKRAKRVKKPQAGFFEKLGIAPKRVVKEIRMSPTEVAQYRVGQTLTTSIFKEGEYVDVIGTSKGKGFQGGVKRWGWRGGAGSHGSMFHRRTGSVSASSYPSRVHKGHHMPGRMGGETVTVQNVEIIKVDAEHNLLVLNGSLPGHRNSIVMVKRAKKHFTKEADIIPQEEQVAVEEGAEVMVAATGEVAETQNQAAGDQENTAAGEKKNDKE
ncbi:MAG: 50S ribosomal protein L3 [Candidatus Omnitrophica bacterium]|nr:50S ribosomal protein L3 [Candidatus Omnitrophota bacterium]